MICTRCGCDTTIALVVDGTKFENGRHVRAVDRLCTGCWRTGRAEGSIDRDVVTSAQREAVVATKAPPKKRGNK